MTLVHSDYTDSYLSFEEQLYDWVLKRLRNILRVSIVVCALFLTWVVPWFLTMLLVLTLVVIIMVRVKNRKDEHDNLIALQEDLRQEYRDLDDTLAETIKQLDQCDRSNSVQLNNCRSKVAKALAFSLRRGFGVMRSSEANVLVRRKFLHKLTKDFERNNKLNTSHIKRDKDAFLCIELAEEYYLIEFSHNEVGILQYG